MQFFRKSALPLVAEWLRVVEADPTGSWDQSVFNQLARAGADFTRTRGLSDHRLFRAFHGRVVGGVLPLTLFCGGHNYFVAQMPQRRGLLPYSVHTTFQYGGGA